MIYERAFLALQILKIKAFSAKLCHKTVATKCIDSQQEKFHNFQLKIWIGSSHQMMKSRAKQASLAYYSARYSILNNGERAFKYGGECVALSVCGGHTLQVALKKLL